MQDMVDQPVRQVIQNIHDLFILFGLITFILLMLIYKLIQFLDKFLMLDLLGKIFCTEWIPYTLLHL